MSMQSRVEIHPWRPAWREAFHRLNAQWLQRHFVIEDVDERMLRDPERYVLQPGGTILFAVLDGVPIGTCALLKEGGGVYELSKMSVDEDHRGLGAGHLLLDAAIAAFHTKGGRHAVPGIEPQAGTGAGHVRARRFRAPAGPAARLALRACRRLHDLPKPVGRALPAEQSLRVHETFLAGSARPTCSTSFRRKPESIFELAASTQWIPAFAGMTIR